MDSLKAMMPSRKSVENVVYGHPVASTATALLAIAATVRMLRNYAARSALDRKRGQKQKSRKEALAALRQKLEESEVFKI